MGIMIFVFLLILSFIGCVFLLANYYLLRQERVRALNVEFFNHMAHEFRTPLANIQLAARLLQKQAHIPRENRFWEIIHSESAQLQQQLESVLELAGMEESEYRLQCEPVQLEDLLHKVVEEMKLQAQERNGEIRLHTPAYAVNCHADKYHLHHAFRNLIDNALKYGGPNPRLHISLHDDAAGVIIRFKDNGPGIALRQRALILRPFRRLSPEDKKGFGLGLPYVKKVVELHRGRLQIISRENDCSTFEICLPRKKTA
jgi:signal transduction histidine kinase